MTDASSKSNGTPVDEILQDGMELDQLAVYAADLVRQLREAAFVKDRLEFSIYKLEKQLKEMTDAGWNEGRAVKLRRLESVFSQFTNVLHAAYLSPIDVINTLRKTWDTELKYVLPAPVAGGSIELPLDTIEKKQDVPVAPTKG